MVGFKEIQKSRDNNEDFSQQKIIALVSFLLWNQYHHQTVRLFRRTFVNHFVIVSCELCKLCAAPEV